MAINPDVLATALQEQLPGYTELFTHWHPLFEKMGQKGNIDSGTLQGPFRDFVVVTDGPGQVTQVNTGSEVIQGGRTQASQRGNEFGTRLIYAFDVPAKDLAEANGEQDLARILQNYPELALSDFHEIMSRQMSTGDGAGVGGWLTFNGNVQYSPNGSGRDGLIELLAPVDQTNNVHGLPSASVSGWQNQYGHNPGADFATSGRAIMRKVFYAAQRQSAKVLGPIDCAFGDEESYLNYLEDLDDYIRITNNTTKDGDMSPDDVRQGVKFETSTLWLEQDIDITADAYAGTAAAFGTGGSGSTPEGSTQGGLIYFIPSGIMKMFTLGHAADKETKGFFDSRGPTRIPDQDMWRYEFVLHGNLHTTSRRHLGAVTGLGGAYT